MAERGPTALETSDIPGDNSVDRDAHARGERNDHSAGPTDSAANGDGESSVEHAVYQGTSDVLDQTRTGAAKAATRVSPPARRATRTVREQARPVVETARAIVGRGVARDRGEAPSEPTSDGGHPSTTAPAASEPGPRADGASREPLGAREAPGAARLVTKLVERFVPMPATATSASPKRRRLASAAVRPGEVGLRESAAPRASATRSPLRLDPLDSAIAPPGDPDPSDGSSFAPGGGLSSTSLMFGGAVATIAAFFLATPSLLRRLRLSPALVWPVAFVSLLERPG